MYIFAVEQLNGSDGVVSQLFESPDLLGFDVCCRTVGGVEEVSDLEGEIMVKGLRQVEVTMLQRLDQQYEGREGLLTDIITLAPTA